MARRKFSGILLFFFFSLKEFFATAAIGLITVIGNVSTGSLLTLAAVAGFGAATAPRVIRARLRGRDREIGVAPAPYRQGRRSPESAPEAAAASTS